jgi:hypothetical protein
VLHHRHLVPIILEDVSDGLPTGAVGESSMHQDDVLNMLCHDHSPLWEKSIRRPLHLHPAVEAFCDGQVEFFCNASTEALHARCDARGRYCYFFIVGN